MNPLWLIFIKGVVLGLGAAAPIGPVNVEMARRTLVGGFRAGFALGCGAVTVDIFYAVCTSLGFALLLNRRIFYWPLMIFGVGFLTYLGVTCWIEAIKAFSSRESDEKIARSPPSLRGGFITGVLMTLLNPMTLAFWFAVVPAGMGSLSQQPSRDLPMICVGVFVGTISWVVGFSGTLALVGRWRRGMWMFLADAFGGTTLLAFAAIAVWKAIPSSKEAPRASKIVPIDPNHGRSLLMKSKPLLQQTSMILAAAVLAGCGVAEPPLFDPRALQQPERTTAAEVRARDMRPIPTTLESTFLAEVGGRGNTATKPTYPPTTGPNIGAEPSVRMSLQEIVQRAVANNLDVKVAGYQPAIDQARVVEADSRFDPVFFANTQYQKQNQALAIPQAGANQTTNVLDQDIVNAQVGIRQALENGGTIELRNEANWTDVVNATQFSGIDPNPFFTNQLVLELQQPVLRDFGNQVNRARITIAKNNQRISLLDFRKQLEETLSQIEQDYWELVRADRDVKIQEELLDQSVNMAIKLLARRDQDVTRVQISQTNSRIQRRRAVLIDSKARLQDLSDRLKRNMNDPDLPITSKVLILPGIRPVEEPIKFDLQDQINTAMENRFELGQQQYRIDNAAEATVVGKNNLLPQLNLIGQLGFQGLSSDYGEAFSNSITDTHFNYSVGIQLEIPIGNRQARAIYQRALLQQQQAVDQYRVIIEQVSLDVKLAARAVDTNWDKIVTARQATFAAADSLEAIEQREAANIEALSPTFIDLKLNQQEQLAEARRAEAEAVSQYNIAIATLEQAKGTLLRYNNVVMEEEKLPYVKTLSMR